VFRIAERNPTIKRLGIKGLEELENVVCAEVVKKR